MLISRAGSPGRLAPNLTDTESPRTKRTRRIHRCSLVTMLPATNYGVAADVNVGEDDRLLADPGMVFHDTRIRLRLFRMPDHIVPVPATTGARECLTPFD